MRDVLISSKYAAEQHSGKHRRGHQSIGVFVGRGEKIDPSEVVARPCELNRDAWAVDGAVEDAFCAVAQGRIQGAPSQIECDEGVEYFIFNVSQADPESRRLSVCSWRQG